MLLSCSSSALLTKEDSQVDVRALKETLYYLSSDDLQGRKSGERGNVLAAGYLEDKLKSSNIEPLFETYRDTLDNFKTTWNVVGVIPAKDREVKEYVVLGAHYDHIGLLHEEDGDNIANGANDNASGVAILTALAEYLSEQALSRNVIVVFFTGEENGLLGAEHLAKRLKKNGCTVSLMLNFEMLGVPMDREYSAYLTGYSKSNVAEVIAERSPKLVGYFEGEAGRYLFQRSDNYPFYLEFNIPSHTFSSFDFENYAYYHHVKDEYGEMDLEHIEVFTKNILPVVKELINAPSGLIKNK